MSEDISCQAVNYQDANNVDKHLLHVVLVSSLLLANTSHQISVSSSNHNQYQRKLCSFTANWSETGVQEAQLVDLLDITTISYLAPLLLLLLKVKG
jgi:hypothetical protein